MGSSQVIARIMGQRDVGDEKKQEEREMHGELMRFEDNLEQNRRPAVVDVEEVTA